MTKNKIFQLILYYSLLTLSVAVLLDLVVFFKALIALNFTAFSLTTFILILESAFIWSMIRLLKNNELKSMFYMVVLYWTLQIFFFGANGNTYTFTIGPEVAIYLKYTGGFEWGHLIKFWSQETSISINNSSDRIFVGLNIVPLVITTLLIVVKRKTRLLDSLG